jgi:hypothetical protein
MKAQFRPINTLLICSTWWSLRGDVVCDERAGLQWWIGSIPGGHQELCPRAGHKHWHTGPFFIGRNWCICIDRSKQPTVQAGIIYYADVSRIRSYDYEALTWEEEATHFGGYGVSFLWVINVLSLLTSCWRSIAESSSTLNCKWCLLMVHDLINFTFYTFSTCG